MINKKIIGLATCFLLFATLMPIGAANAETQTKNFQVNSFQARLTMRFISAITFVDQPDLDLKTLVGPIGMFNEIESVPTYSDLVVVRQLLTSMTKVSDSQETNRLLGALGDIAGDYTSIATADILTFNGDKNNQFISVRAKQGIDDVFKNCECEDQSTLTDYVVKNQIAEKSALIKTLENLKKAQQKQIDAIADETIKTTVQENTTDQATNPALAGKSWCGGSGVIC